MASVIGLLSDKSHYNKNTDLHSSNIEKKNPQLCFIIGLNSIIIIQDYVIFKVSLKLNILFKI